MGLSGFFLIVPNLLSFILLCEVIWISLYILAIISSIYLDSALFISWGLFLLCISTAESSLGFSILMFKFILYHNVRDEYCIAANNLNSANKFGYVILSYINA
jgi:NADH:ubiquinone oxidoreductase subunit K